jgi:hypothetical protein
LSGGRLLLALDGLDEISDQGDRDVFLDRLMSVCQELPRVRVILTTRESVPTDRLRDFTHLRIEPFNPAQVQQWAQQYLITHNPRHGRWREFLDLARFDKDFSELVRNPLLLALASSLHWKYPDELNSRATLLRKCVEVLIQDWDAARGIARWHRSNITPRQIRRLLNKLSAMLVSQKRDNRFSMADVDATIKSMTGFRVSSDALLDACRTSGIVTYSDDDQYSFTHQSYFDYFAANYVVSWTDEGVEEKIQIPSIREDHTSFWRLSCALSSDANGLLERVIEYGNDGKRAEKRAAAYMLAQALGEEVSASKTVIDNCCQHVVSALEERLDRAQPLDASLVRETWPEQKHRFIVWASGATVRDSGADDDEFRTVADLIELVYRARTATTSTFIEKWLRASPVALVRQIADALAHDGWCHTHTGRAPDNSEAYLYLVITRSVAAETEAETEAEAEAETEAESLRGQSAKAARVAVPVIPHRDAGQDQSGRRDRGYITGVLRHGENIPLCRLRYGGSA